MFGVSGLSAVTQSPLSMPGRSKRIGNKKRKALRIQINKMGI